jgi:hypothetical protein
MLEVILTVIVCYVAFVLLLPVVMVCWGFIAASMTPEYKAALEIDRLRREERDRRLAQWEATNRR